MDDDGQDKPQDLSIKSKTSPPTATVGTTKKVKPIPPPLDLNVRNLEEAPSGPRTPKSPCDLPRECLPLRKRPLLDGRRDLHAKSPRSAGPSDRGATFSAIDFQQRSTNTAPSSPISTATFSSYSSFLSVPSASPGTCPLTLTPSSAKSMSAFSPFSLPSIPPPPPLIPIQSGAAASPMHAAAAAAVLAAAAAAAANYPTPPTELANTAYSWTFPSPFSPVVPISPMTFPSTAMLSPAPSHQSSTNSSREELGSTGNTLSAIEEGKRRFLSAAFGNNGVSGPVNGGGHSPLPVSPLMSPMNRVYSYPVFCWQCFLPGSKIRFLLPNTNTPWQRSEELGWKDRISSKIDSNNHYQFAPNGLSVLKVDVVNGGGETSVSAHEPDENQRLILRMGPHRSDNSFDILAECSLTHPFYVKDKGWCSARPRATFDAFGIPCRDLAMGDVCLAPDHQDAAAVRTPDLCDRFRRFEFSTTATSSLATTSCPLEAQAGTPLAPTARGAGSSATIHRPVPILHGAKSHVMSPPMSPAKKKEKDPDKPKRPMNGFMLFAKKFRLELIQQHPGKDNRAISVLLGESWKNLPPEDRDHYSQRAKLLADEKKKMYPDCWKRKRTVTNVANKDKGATSPAALLSPSPMIGSTPLIQQEGSM